MSEKEKRDQGLLYNANKDLELLNEREKCKDYCYEFNQLMPSEKDEQEAIINTLFGDTSNNYTILAPFYCDYGYNIHIGEDFFLNHNAVILDGASVTFGDHVYIGPNCSFYTAGHPFDVQQRNEGLEYAKPITIKDNVWIGGNVVVLPGVTIGNNSVIGAGSVVTKDIPDNVVVAGNPCQIIKELK